MRGPRSRDRDAASSHGAAILEGASAYSAGFSADWVRAEHATDSALSRRPSIASATSASSAAPRGRRRTCSGRGPAQRPRLDPGQVDLARRRTPAAPRRAPPGGPRRARRRRAIVFHGPRPAALGPAGAIQTKRVTLSPSSSTPSRSTTQLVELRRRPGAERRPRTFGLAHDPHRLGGARRPPGSRAPDSSARREAARTGRAAAGGRGPPRSRPSASSSRAIRLGRTG